MSGTLLETDKLLLHVQPPRPDNRHYFCRLFAPPAGPIDPETGQPFKPYTGTLLVVISGDSGEVQGALALKPSAMRMLHLLGRHLGVKTLWWETWDFRIEADKSVSWFKRPRTVLNIKYPNADGH